MEEKQHLLNDKENQQLLSDDNINYEKNRFIILRKIIIGLLIICVVGIMSLLILFAVGLFIWAFITQIELRLICLVISIFVVIFLIFVAEIYYILIGATSENITVTYIIFLILEKRKIYFTQKFINIFINVYVILTCFINFLLFTMNVILFVLICYYLFAHDFKYYSDGVILSFFPSEIQKIIISLSPMLIPIGINFIFRIITLPIKYLLTILIARIFDDDVSIIKKEIDEPINCGQFTKDFFGLLDPSTRYQN